MLPKDLLDKIHRIEITTSRLVTDMFAGKYHSAFKGRGIEFDEVREYQIGDDIRAIDWNVTARTGKAHIKKFIEERELTVMILVDVSRSCQFASINQLKSKLAAEIAAIFAFSAIRNNDKVGLLIFTDQIELYIPPRKGRSHVLRVIREILYFKPKGTGTDLKVALEFLSQIMRRKTVTFVLSDFLTDDSKDSDSLKKVLSIVNKRHDIIAITLSDQREMKLPNCGLINLQDAETGKRITIDSANEWVREDYEREALARQNSRSRLFRLVGIDHINIFTHIPYEHSLIAFFLQRKHRYEMQ